MICRKNVRNFYKLKNMADLNFENDLITLFGLANGMIRGDDNWHSYSF